MIMELVTEHPGGPLRDGDIVVVTSKIVSKAEGRTADRHRRDDLVRDRVRPDARPARPDQDRPDPPRADARSCGHRQLQCRTGARSCCSRSIRMRVRPRSAKRCRPAPDSGSG